MAAFFYNPYPAEWSSASDQMYYVNFPGEFPIYSDQTIKPLLNEKHTETVPQVSPDGRWMAYTSDETGQNEIYVRPFPEVNEGKWQVSTGGGDSPLWSPDGRELFYRSGDTVMVV